MRSLDELREWMDARAGICHVTAVRDAGFTVHGIRRAVDTGMLQRVRRSWLATPGCDPLLRRAAETGGRLTCLSAASRAGLWTPVHGDLVHVAVAPTASRIGGDGLRLHWSRGPVPVAATALEDPVINVLLHVARCIPRPDAAAVWESAIRKKHVAADVLARVDWRCEVARGLAATASSLSDSGIETRFVLLMRSIGVVVAQQVSIDGHRVDGLIGERLVVQLDGFAHHQARDRRRDIRADARLALRGYTVLRFDYHQVMFEPDDVIAVVANAIAQGLHR
ncbi:endonuclease domain-containing protein [Microbacterium sp. 18062]|uniref:endonuclease domain-containing protein n=1 Tax=Microbacterium sp. 18062 TaxID=2681410 RepID=UPI00135A40F2|nr:DUF559 domain-containing protein [Microbacterium sp. 18062]